MKRVNLNIDKLVLHDVNTQDQAELTQAIKAELQRQFTQTATFKSLQNMPDHKHINAGTVRLKQHASPKNAGQQIGNGIATAVKTGKASGE